MLVGQASAQPVIQIPREPPQKMPERLLVDFENGKNGDVFAMIRANRWHENVEETEVFPKEVIRKKLESLVQQGNPKAMVALADRLPWDLVDPQKNKVLPGNRELT
jgi:hypothetical protein